MERGDETSTSTTNAEGAATNGEEPAPFTYDGGRVDPGETATVRYEVSETYLGDPVRVPVTIVNGPNAGPTLFLAAATHGDELNGVEVVREVAHGWDHDDLHGTLVCLPVVNVPGFLTQQRSLPGLDRDLNRAFPGREGSTSDRRIAHAVFETFIEPCDAGLDFHTATRGRTNMLHVRADTGGDGVTRLARAFGTGVIVDGPGPEGSLRRAATAAGVPTVTVEMGEAHRLERDLIDRALDGVESVLAEYGLRPDASVDWPGWRTEVARDRTTWLRADTGGLVDMRRQRGELVREGEVICEVADPFGPDADTVTAPFTGLLVGVLQNPVVAPGNPLCRLVEVDDDTRAAPGRRRDHDTDPAGPAP